MDNFEITYQVNKCFHLKHKFFGVFASDNFPRLSDNCFAVVNASISTSSGSHWLLICYYEKTMYFADPLWQARDCYHFVYTRLLQFYFGEEVVQCRRLQPIQSPNSKLCGLHCIYIAHIIFTYSYPFVHYMNDDDLLRFAKHMM